MPLLFRKTVDLSVIDDDVPVVDELATLGYRGARWEVSIEILVEAPEPVHRLERDVEDPFGALAHPEALRDDAERLGADAERAGVPPLG